MDGIFDKFIVVDEKSFNGLKIGMCKNHQTEDYPKFSDVTPFAALEFQIDNLNARLKINDIGNISKSEVPLAQIMRWEWDQKGEQVIKETHILYNGGSTLWFSGKYSSFSIVVRILQKREKNNENLCLPLSSPDDDLTVQIGDKKIIVSAHWFMSVSPVIRRMLSVEMREKQQRLITLDELGVDMEMFMEFVEAISPISLQTPLFPNSKNVLVLLKLADFFQVDCLKLSCEMHLINCVEIPLIDRYLLINRYRLNNLKKYFLNLDVYNLGAFYKANGALLVLSGNETTAV